MNNFPWLVSLTVLSAIQSVNGLIIAGPKTNMSKVFYNAVLMGTNKIPNMLPDLTYNENLRPRWPGSDAARRFLKKYINVLREQEYSRKKFLNDDFTDYDETSKQKSEELTAIGQHIVKSISRRFRDLKKEREKEKKARGALIKKQHENRMKEITEFMNDHWLTTRYLYDEVKRIKKQRIVKDSLREMVEYLEYPDRTKLKEAVLKCYKKLTKKYKTGDTIWAHKTNNLVINSLKSPYD